MIMPFGPILGALFVIILASVIFVLITIELIYPMLVVLGDAIVDILSFGYKMTNYAISRFFEFYFDLIRIMDEEDQKRIGKKVLL